MRKYLGRVPFGVWFGAAVLLLSASTRYELGIFLGLVLIVVTMITTRARDRARAAEEARLSGQDPERGLSEE
ncbi:MAG: hypothetical protein JWQ74_2801 [Marmoricola sp.]|nr:hypothetical protein [Marmoricola sp.]